MTFVMSFGQWPEAPTFGRCILLNQNPTVAKNMVFHHGKGTLGHVVWSREKEVDNDGWRKYLRSKSSSGW